MARVPCRRGARRRLKAEDFEPYFNCSKRLLPKPSDLSYFNWETQRSTSNSSPNFQVRSPGLQPAPGLFPPDMLWQFRR